MCVCVCVVDCLGGRRSPPLQTPMDGVAPAVDLALDPEHPLGLLKEPCAAPLASSMLAIVPQVMERLELGASRVDQRPIHEVHRHADPHVPLCPQRSSEFASGAEHVP